jgi:hypothetical protein
MVANFEAESDFCAGENCTFAFTALENCRRWNSDIAFPHDMSIIFSIPLLWITLLHRIEL